MTKKSIETTNYQNDNIERGNFEISAEQFQGNRRLTEISIKTVSVFRGLHCIEISKPSNCLLDTGIQKTYSTSG